MAKQSQELASLVRAMRKIESAFTYAETLADKDRERVFSWVEDTYFNADK